jgi:exosortase
MAVLIALYFPIIVIHVANPEWRPFGYLIALQAILLTWLGIYISAGWKVAWHFAFPIGFFLVAVPWPRPLDAPLMDFLMQKNAGVAIEGLLWQGIAASSKGNLVILPTGTVGVDEACSGIRSLQGTLMLALFLGEILRLGILRRIFLVVAGAGVALMTNAVRTFLLARGAALSGINSVESWHDSAGLVILAVNFVILWGISLLLTRLRSHGHKWFWNWWGRVSSYTGHATDHWVIPSRYWTVATAAVIVGGFVFSAWWFDRGQTHAEAPIEWKVAEPVAERGFKRERIPDKVLITLRNDSGWTARWESPEKAPMQAWYLRWRPGRNAAQLANMHDPRVCLGGMGLEMQAELDTWNFQTGPLVLPIRSFRFRDGPQTVHLYYALLDDRRATRMGKLYDNSILNRLQATWDGVKNRGQRLIEIGLWGDFPESHARKMVEDFLAAHIVVGES